MVSDYLKISTYNEEMLGKDRASRISQVSMYADTAHFVYEILQNADDAGAKEVVFKIFDDRLVIEHDGKLFTSDDVKAISYFGKGKTDITKIGHFGLGFKSVFAYTASPRIHSGCENFEITDLYTLRAVISPQDLERNRTRFVLPFDHELCRPAYIEAEKLKKAITARNEILAKMSKIGSETLLFTRNITEIRWDSECKSGHYLREERLVSEGIRELFIVTEEGDQSCFLLFERPVDTTAGNEIRQVQIAYKLNNRLSEGGAIIPVLGAKLFVFFQTDKETHTNLIFQAPYRTTPARDNVPEDDEFNNLLVQQSADLLVKSLLQLKKMKLLSLEALSTLPLDFERFVEGSFFYPLHAAVRNALQNLPLLQTSTGGFVSSRNAKIARPADMTKIFNAVQLESLFCIKEVRWLNPTLTSNNYPILHQFILGRRRSQRYNFQKADWLYEPLAEEIEVSAENIKSRLTASFMEAQTEEWLNSFMLYVSNSRLMEFRKIPIIRLESGKHVFPENKDGEPNAYLTTQEGSVKLGRLPIVKKSLLANQDIVKFLQDDLGLGYPDFADYALKRVLPKYQKKEQEVNLSSWKKDFRILVSGITTKSFDKKRRLLDVIKKTKFLVGVLASNRDVVKHVTPCQLYLSSPELDEYFACEDTFFITSSECYEQNDKDVLLAMGVGMLPRITRREKDERQCVMIRNRHSDHMRGLDGFDPGWAIEGLTAALQNPTPVRSQLIWKLLLADFSCIRGTVQSSSQQSFGNLISEEMISATGLLLMSSAWLPAKDGSFFKPCDISLEELAPSFESASLVARSLGEKLGMKKPLEQDAIAILARGDSKKRNLIEKIMNATEDELEAFNKLIPTKLKLPEFKSFKEGIQSLQRVSTVIPSDEGREYYPVANPERYRRNAEESVREAKLGNLSNSRNLRFSVIRDFSTNKSAREFLEQEYQGRCQVKNRTFPKHSGGNYFEALTLVERFDAEHLNDAGNMLCLCADTAAQFMHADFTWIDSFEDKILRFKAEKEGGNEEMRKISALVAGNILTITWSERHFIRLCALWNTA